MLDALLSKLANKQYVLFISLLIVDLMLGDALSVHRLQITVKILDFFTGPRCAAQEYQAGFDAGVFGKTVDLDTVVQAFPAVLGMQTGQNHLQGDAM